MSDSDFDQTDENMSMLSNERKETEQKNMPIAYDVKSFDKKPSMKRNQSPEKDKNQKDAENARYLGLKNSKVAKMPTFLNTPESLGNFETPSKININQKLEIQRESLDAEKFLSINEV